MIRLYGNVQMIDLQLKHVADRFDLFTHVQLQPSPHGSQSTY